MIRRKLTQHNFLGKCRYYDWMQIIKKKHKQMARRLGRQIGDRRDNFSRQSFFLLAMATKTVAAWSADLQTAAFRRIQFHSYIFFGGGGWVGVTSPQNLRKSNVTIRNYFVTNFANQLHGLENCIKLYVVCFSMSKSISK